MEENFKKQIKFLLIGLALSVVFVPGVTSAQSLGIQAVTTGITASVGQSFPLKATTSDNRSGVLVTFTVSDINGSAITWVTMGNGGRCTTDSSGTCLVNVTPTQVGSFYVAVSASGYQSAVTGSPITAAHGLTISANPQTLQPGQNSVLTVRSSIGQSGIVITFGGVVSIPGLPSLLSSPTCTTATGGACTVTFSSSQAGNFRVKASALNHNNTAEIPITVLSSTQNAPTQNAPAAPRADTTTYTPLVPLPDTQGGVMDTVNVGGQNSIGTYLNLIIKLIIGLAAVLAVVMIVWGGIEYMTSELISSKEAGKNRITQALLGLLLALGSWIILSEINPKILDTDFTIDPATITFTEGPETIVSRPADITAVCGKTTTVNGQTVTSCDDSEIVQINFLGHDIRVNRAIVGNLSSIDLAWRISTDPRVRNYTISSVDGYNNRAATGSNPPSPSAHAFGLAVDINPATNPYVDSSSPCTTDMPPAFVQLFTSRGFGWGGYWINKKDAMHFSKLPNEQKYVSGTCAGLVP